MTDQSLYQKGFKSLGNDFLASIVVFLVAVPLCIGIALAIGLPPTYGLISGIIGGLVVGALGGCSLQVSGPAAGLITIIWESVQEHGIENFGAIVFLAGLLQVVFSVFRFGQWFRAVSPALVQGMLAGIGVLIFASQFHVMMDDKPANSGVENLLALPSAVMKGIFPLDGTTHHIAGLIGMITILVIVAWSYAPKSLKLVPAPLVGIIVAVIIAAVFQMPINYVKVPDNLFAIEYGLSWDSLSYLLNHAAIISALTIAIVASTESLLTATAIDKMSVTCRTDYNKELRAQGIGNVLAGILGALPITGVIVRSAANVQAGAVSKLSSILHGVWLLVFLVLIPQVLELIPIAALAAVLVYTGYKLINPTAIKNLLQISRSEVIIYAITVFAIVSTNLLEGIIIGFVLSALKLLYNLSYFNANLVEDHEAGTVNLFMEGSATFLNLPRLAMVLESISPNSEVNIYPAQLYYIDHACMDLLMSWEKQHLSRGGTVNFQYNGEQAGSTLVNSKFKKMLSVATLQ